MLVKFLGLKEITEYDEERNKYILDALKVSAQLSEENDNNDLYNEKMASKLR